MPSLRFGRSIRITDWTSRTPEQQPAVKPHRRRGKSPFARCSKEAVRGRVGVWRQRSAVRACCSGSCAKPWRSRWLRRTASTRSSTSSPTNMQADVCSFYVLRDDGALELFATLRPEARIRPHDDAAAGRGPGRPDRRAGRAAQSRKCPGASGLRLPARKPAKTRSAPSSACRCCAPARRSACWSCRTATARVYGEDETEALLTTATILAEMIATSEFDTLIKPGQDIDLRRPRTFTGAELHRRHRARQGRAARPARRGHQFHRRGHRPRKPSGSRRRSPRCGSRSTTC